MNPSVISFYSSIAVFSFLILFGIIALNGQKEFTNITAYGQTTAPPSSSSDNADQSIPKDRIKGYEALSLENGKPISVSNATGELIVLNSWATWCVPCREEMPGLEQLYEDYKNSGLEVIGVSVDSFGMDDRIKVFTERMGITYPIWHDPKDTFTRTFKAIGVPESYLIDRNGTIYHQWKGQFDPTAESTKSIVEN